MNAPHRDADTEAVIMDAAWVIYLRAHADARARHLEVTDDLAFAIEIYDLIHSGLIHPATFWPDLETDPAPWDTGLRRAAEETLVVLAEVIRQAPDLIEEGTVT